MNVNLVAVAKRPEAVDQVRRRMSAAIEYVKDIFGEAEDHELQRGWAFAYNADRMARTWTASTWFDVEGFQYGVSQPPIPSDADVTAETLPRIVHDRVHGSGRPSSFLMNHWGYSLSPQGDVRVWTDLVGFDRAYVVGTQEWIAFANHIGALAFFLEGPLEIDDQAVGMFANFGWFTEHGSPFRGISRLPRAVFVDVDAQGGVQQTTYQSLEELTGTRDQPADFSAVVAASRTAAGNMDKLSLSVPTVYLSGGQDSRMTAGLWLSGGGSAKVMTLGTLPKEAEVAADLMERLGGAIDLEGQGVTHRIVDPQPSEVTMPLPERLTNCHLMWDGDSAPTNMKRNMHIARGAAALSIGGTNGEITHGYFYSRPGYVERISALEHPLKHLLRIFPGRVTTAAVQDGLEDFFDKEYAAIRDAGSPGLQSMDVYYFREKLRRWHNQSLSNTSVVLLGSSEYIRMAFDLSVEERIDKRAPKEIARRAVPQWDGVPYYKATKDESKIATKKGLRTWSTDTEVFNAVLDEPRIWDRYLRREQLEAFRQLIPTGEAFASHESWLNRAIWIDSIDEHRQRLNQRTAAAREAR
ncbi:MAG: hypothetical protein LBE67_12565 [Kocuria palustris]|mgnify:CR=1 FL=1|uniref:hypothetical protein n=1 Tax=Kocuria palustris TaxID=71999 RepID=UPI001D4E9032|nr:hypothetical protein [Kocuria palustris]MBZ6375797.1 hypothetical protein [Kocuria palustris]